MYNMSPCLISWQMTLREQSEGCYFWWHKVISGLPCLSPCLWPCLWPCLTTCLLLCLSYDIHLIIKSIYQNITKGVVHILHHILFTYYITFTHYITYYIIFWKIFNPPTFVIIFQIANELIETPFLPLSDYIMCNR